LANSRTPCVFASIGDPGDLHGRQKALVDRQCILFLISASFCTAGWIQASGRMAFGRQNL
jgi:hypothetical protein